ncbi:hypothetical protein HMPREF1604_04632 [Escherichia coli 908519]|nr:hypothetical protein HMPREF1604_04632 [Escherichia coli 908519]UNS24832.1 hypothetical protein [Escherichia coli]UWM22041.1 hypothetical protein [Morganella morganii]UWM22342.1 hypothetical protein [Klebsiella pneumoniae]UVX22228.1 hypothetical protein [Escherichia coli]
MQDSILMEGIFRIICLQRTKQILMRHLLHHNKSDCFSLI